MLYDIPSKTKIQDPRYEGQIPSENSNATPIYRGGLWEIQNIQVTARLSEYCPIFIPTKIIRNLAFIRMVSVMAYLWLIYSLNGSETTVNIQWTASSLWLIEQLLYDLARQRADPPICAQDESDSGIPLGNRTIYWVMAYIFEVRRQKINFHLTISCQCSGVRELKRTHGMAPSLFRSQERSPIRYSDGNSPEKGTGVSEWLWDSQELFGKGIHKLIIFT